jgi:hypothetical protein
MADGVAVDRMNATLRLASNNYLSRIELLRLQHCTAINSIPDDNRIWYDKC